MYADELGAFLGMKNCLHLLKNCSGNVVNVSSILAVSGAPGITTSAYHASKGAIQAMTKSAASSWAKLGIRVNCVHPGTIETPILRDLDREMLASANPMGRLGKPEEIASLIAFLGSSDASFMTGSECVCDGGQLAS